MEEKIIVGIIVSAIAFFSVYLITPVLIKALEKRNLCVKDANKKENVMIARPGGISIIIGLVNFLKSTKSKMSCVSKRFP